jgi:hypothetical protein
MPHGHRNKSIGLEFYRFGRSRFCEAFVKPLPRDTAAIDGFSQATVMG